jgi:oxygen-independent coproporphyrinogen-3 oxidase
MENKSDLAKAIVKEIDLRKNYLGKENIDTIYFGGGTPSVLSDGELKTILGKIYNEFSVNENAEITLECNPDDLFKERLMNLKKAGVNRLSIGLQSFNDDELKWMNRVHTARESIESVLRAQDSGFDNITIDLIYGSKYQNMGSWEQTLQTALNLRVQHISAYNLTIENKTKLALDHQKGNEPGVNEELSADQFKLMIDTLQSNDFVHYEISNFGKEGFFSKHNSNYWKGVTYLGLGPSAHSFDGKTRQWNVRSNSSYIQKVSTGGEYFEIETLSEKEKHNEYILTRLRTIWGCDKKEIEKNFGKEVLDSFNNNLIKHHRYLNINGDVVTLNTEGKLKADFLAAEFFI